MSLLFAIVTGGNTGMGLALAKELCKQGYHVTISARSKDKAVEAVQIILVDVPDAHIEYLLMDLNSLASVTDFAQQYLASGHPLHLLVNNAGIMNTPFAKTGDGFEAQFQVNHLGHFLLTHHLLPVLLATAENTPDAVPSRIINISSRAHMRWSGALTDTVLDEATLQVTAETYDGWRSYGLSKLCNILFTRSLAQRYPYPSRPLLVFSLHPGLVDTKLLNVAPGLSRQAIPIDAGIRTALFLATSSSDDERLEHGGYFYECALATGPSAISVEAQSLIDAAVLWTKSLAYVGLTDDAYGGR
eukprot:gene16798-12017_t